MRGGTIMLALAALLLLFSVSPLRAQDPYYKPLDRTIGSGVSVIKFDDIAYRFTADASFSLRIERIDTNHIRVFIKPVKQEPRPYYEVGVQWGNFGGIVLDFTSPDGDSFTFNTETGYAEK
jgi:hypothetical protein